MKNPRFTGLLLLLTGVLVLMGNTMDVLPPQAFWAGLLTYPIGGYLFFMGSRESLGRADTRTTEVLNRRLRKDARETPAKPTEQGTASAAAPEAPSESRIIAALRKPASEGKAKQSSPPLALHDLEEDEGGPQGDVSAPRAAPSPAAPTAPAPAQKPSGGATIAERIAELTKLQQQGVITAEEFAAAKAKLTG